MAQMPEMPSSGQRYQGEVESDLAVLRGWSWPYTAISGAEDGPRATVIAGIHGCEYVSIYAAMRLAAELDPNEVRGQILIVPIVNLPSFWERTPFVGPYDGKNLNRLFPGKATGTFSEALAYFTFNTFILPSEAFIDLHGGDMVEDLAPFTGYMTDAEPSVAARSRAMADAFGLPYIIGRMQGLSAPAGLTHTAAASRGIASVLAEAGGIGQLTMPDVDLLVEGTRRALQASGNLPGEPQLDGEPPRFLEKSQTLFAGHDGFWICNVRAGDTVEEGQELGRIHSLTGDLLETVNAPFAGDVVYRTTSAAVKQGGLLMNVGA
jgi:predicted deacylase